LKRKRISRTEALIIAAALIAAGGLSLFNSLKSAENATATVLLDGKAVFSARLDGKPRAFNVPGISGAEFEISEGAIRVSHSDCPDGVCVNTGPISSPERVIVCVPKHFVIKIDESGDHPDAVV
jgi:hypothetical protein